jgi:hypothetical protein
MMSGGYRSVGYFREIPSLFYGQNQTLARRFWNSLSGTF